MQNSVFQAAFGGTRQLHVGCILRTKMPNGLNDLVRGTPLHFGCL
nr:hypothetical protein [Alysiella crassa]